MINDLDHSKFEPQFELKNASRGTDSIPNTTNLPNLPRATGSLSGVEVNINPFITNPAPINGSVPSEIDSRTLGLINDQVPGTFTQSPGSMHGLEVPFDSPKMTKESFI